MNPLARGERQPITSRKVLCGSISDIVVFPRMARVKRPSHPDEGENHKYRQAGTPRCQFLHAHVGGQTVWASWWNRSRGKCPSNDLTTGLCVRTRSIEGSNRPITFTQLETRNRPNLTVVFIAAGAITATASRSNLSRGTTAGSIPPKLQAPMRPLTTSAACAKRWLPLGPLARRAA